MGGDLGQNLLDGLRGAESISPSSQRAWLPLPPAQTGGNAAQHNELVTLSIFLELVDKGLQAYDALRLAKAIDAGNHEEALDIAQEISIGLATDIIPGNVILAKIGLSLNKFGLVGLGGTILRKLGGDAVGAGAGKFAQLATKADEAVFWSGRTHGVGGESVAKGVAGNSAGTTLEMLLEQKGIKMPDFNTPAGKLAWEEASLEMAKQASGKVRVVLGKDIRTDSVWSRIEFPELVKNKNVKEITAIDPKTGVLTTLFRR